jgi:lysophospholipid acyltransferase 5
VQKKLSSASVWPQHLFCVLSGFSIAYFSYGVDSFHFVGIIIISWFLLRVFGQTFIAAFSVFLWSFGYLMVGYYVYGTEDYDINWTTSYCVMCLRLIGFAIDYYDGRSKSSNNPPLKSAEKAGKEASPTKSVESTTKQSIWDNVSLTKLPSLLETFAYCFYFGGFSAQFHFHEGGKFVSWQNVAY